MKKILSLILIGILAFSLFACGTQETGQGGGADTPGESSQELPKDTAEEITLEKINQYLNKETPNNIAVIPFTHVDGGGTDSDYHAFIKFAFKEKDYVKYQISYISCTWRAPAVNYWQNAYVELSLPESKNVDDVVVNAFTFEKDGGDGYKVAAWGDSDPIPGGVSYEVFKEEFIPFFIGKDYGYIKDLDVYTDIKQDDFSAGEGRDGFDLDTYTGSSTSASNIIRMLNALKDYHEATFLK